MEQVAKAMTHEHSPRTSVDEYNTALQISTRRGWLVLDGDRMWTDGVIYLEDGKAMMHFLETEQSAPPPLPRYGLAARLRALRGAWSCRAGT